VWEIVGEVIAFLKNLSPVVLIILGILLYFFSGAMKGLAKVVGAVMVIWGIITLFGFAIPLLPTANALGLVRCLAI
jgi:hypothetical protein